MPNLQGPKPGDAAPAFTLPAPGGEVALGAGTGGKTVLYFYPRDDTPGCTTEALDFTTEAAAFAAAGVTVIGVSKDSVQKHEKFIAKHGLGVVLASDEHGTTAENYGVWVEKNMYGKVHMGVERATFLIDAAGVVRQVWRKVKVKGHVADVLRAAQALD
ncbi:peroxiredoxin [Pikeienuella piscinae]|uniref:thioredoxin-dependent peroxiredoxin n=1 Tax=Pikeienuella piscinae TaxID=2748098 RepID=A0A7L5C0I1_9RHOB|nr:peroxiredoxin [Pikeienuella piscinae]QIE55349.1 peroxiredoxin [Pikeienuella piscinae]